MFTEQQSGRVARPSRRVSQREFRFSAMLLVQFAVFSNLILVAVKRKCVISRAARLSAASDRREAQRARGCPP